VLKAFSLPGTGVCNEARGFFESGPFWANGIACGSSDGDEITFSLTAMKDNGSVMITDFFKLLRASPTTAVPGKECAVVGSTGCFSATYAKIACSPRAVPVP
jgi:hypothetical protein